MKNKKHDAMVGPEARDSIPRLSVTFTDETTWLTRYDNGQPTITYPVAVGDVANAFKEFGASTGLLAPDTLWWQSKNGETEIAIWLPPVRRVISFAAGRKTHRLKLPPLGFVFVGSGVHYRLFAALKRPTSERDVLYHAPLPNIHTDGNVCPGNVQFPKCTSETIGQAATLFWESYFNSDLSDRKLRGCDVLFKGLQALSGKRQFPAECLYRAFSIRELIAGKQPHSEFDGPEDFDEPDPFGFADLEDEDDDD